MKKMFAVGIAVALVALFIGGVYAQGMWTGGQRGTYHEQMEQVLEEGTYDDLVALRLETGGRMMPWVQDAESFAQMQERHKTMEAQYGEGPHRQNDGMRGNCQRS